MVYSSQLIVQVVEGPATWGRTLTSVVSFYLSENKACVCFHVGLVSPTTRAINSFGNSLLILGYDDVMLFDVTVYAGCDDDRAWCSFHQLQDIAASACPICVSGATMSYGSAIISSIYEQPQASQSLKCLVQLCHCHGFVGVISPDFTYPKVPRCCSLAFLVM